MRVVNFILLGILLLSSGCRREWPGVYLRGQAIGLELAREDWIRLGRPTSFDPLKEGFYPTNTCFVYTNTVVISNKIARCCFASRDPKWPPGTLAITDEGVTLWIYSDGRKIIISPEESGVPW